MVRIHPPPPFYVFAGRSNCKSTGHARGLCPPWPEWKALYGCCAQFARTPARSSGRSRKAHEKSATVAALASGTGFQLFRRSCAGEVPEIGTGQGLACPASDCLAIGEPASGRKSDLYEFDGSNPSPTTIFYRLSTQSRRTPHPKRGKAAKNHGCLDGIKSMAWRRASLNFSGLPSCRK